MNTRKDTRSICTLISRFFKDVGVAASLPKAVPETNTCFHKSDTLFDNKNRVLVNSVVQLSTLKEIRAFYNKNDIACTLNDIVLCGFNCALRE